MGKGEIARYEQFLLFPKCFQKAYFPEASKGVIVWEWVNLQKKYFLMVFPQPFPKRQILDSFKVKEFPDHNFKFDSNGRKFSYRVENSVGKGEIARNEQFLLFPHCFQKDLYYRHVKTRACLGKS